jgi:hypothetical protein
LNFIVFRDKENLENQFRGLLEQVAEFREVFIDLGNQLLEQLYSSERNLLENTTLVSTLANTKTNS